jgi:hypothetical protein
VHDREYRFGAHPQGEVQWRLDTTSLRKLIHWVRWELPKARLASVFDQLQTFQHDQTNAVNLLRPSVDESTYPLEDYLTVLREGRVSWLR